MPLGLGLGVGFGVGARWAPKRLPGVRLWLRRDLGISLSAGRVAAWADQSGAGNHYSQGTGSKQPLYGASSGALGGPGVEFDGAASVLAGPVLSALIAASAFHVFAVLKPTAISRNDPAAYYNGDGIWCDHAGYAGIFAHSRSSGTAVGGAYAGAQQTSAAGLTVGALHLVELKLSNPTLSIRVDGGSFASAACGVIGNLLNATNIGGGLSSTKWGAFVLSEIVICNAVQSAADVARYRSYAAAAFGVTT